MKKKELPNNTGNYYLHDYYKENLIRIFNESLIWKNIKK